MSEGSGIALEGRLGQAYTEDAFRQLLATERRRADRSGRPFALLLVDLRPRSRGLSEPLPPLVARKLFESLWLCLRDTDFVGWYRAETVAGAVLTELPDGLDVVAPNGVAARVSRTLTEHLAPDVGHRVRLRLHLRDPRAAAQAAAVHHPTLALG